MKKKQNQKQVKGTAETKEEKNNQDQDQEQIKNKEEHEQEKKVSDQKEKDKKDSDKSTFLSVVTADHNKQVFKKLIFFMIIMVILPLGTFFLFDRVILANRLGKHDRLLWSGVAAIITTILIKVAYVIVAFLEKPAPEIPKSKKEN
ncbi:vacuolar atpase assembly integral membrane protein vma21 [Anaeramoeba flamelloides]|uniref:Vacuolar atpase assembly integral membrane protein vma21 n=1 Tax=Anaeramoeba flamelloides TaxID=1746091 RepID=A0AAV7Z7N7_9EUKA|nr:vacuolar atpase assembly integral membrane protein vma21 [Anaeramoeba flamelloides]KAJ6240806.1 vacuolar atpase assembly integral membrane protein vma21 [Anaeramoeba flamelloides]